MKVSIITVAYNAETTIGATLDSVKSQSYSQIEHIVIDGKSTDGTLDIIDGFLSHITKVVSEKDSGIYDAMNKGLSLASGDVIGFLNADDTFANSETIATIAETFLTSSFDTVYGDLQYVDLNNSSKIIRNWNSGEYSKNKFLKGWMPAHPTFYAKRELFDKFGGFNTLFRISADYELMLRFLFKYGCSSKYIPHVLVKMKMGGESNRSLSNRLKANNEDRKAWAVNGLHPKFYTRIMKPLRKLNQFFN